MNQQTQAPPPEQTSSGSNVLLVIIVVIVVGLLILGAGGYFGWKYLQKKLAISATPVPTSTLVKSPAASPTVTPAATASPTATTTPTSSGLKTGTMPVNGYVISGSDSRLISESEIINFTPWQLKVARNEIYARHGRPFVHKDLQCYFANQNWYHGNPNYSDALLSVVENKNVNTAKTYEEKTNSPLQSYDSGC